MLTSGLFGVYAILVPAMGIFLIGLVMLEGPFGKVASMMALATGVFGVLSVIGPMLTDALTDAAGVAAIVTSVLTTLWVLLVGGKLLTGVRPM